jgi:alanine racemase
MDQTMIDVGHIDGVQEGDEVILLGRQGAESVTADDHARLTSTINYEVVSRILARVPRVYVENAE